MKKVKDLVILKHILNFNLIIQEKKLMKNTINA